MKYSDWLTKKQAADALEVSTKTVEKFASDKLLEFVMTKNPETGATIVKYHPRDVRKLRKERMPDAAPFVLPPDGTVKILKADDSPAALMELPAAPGIGAALVKTLAEGMTRATAQMFERQANAVPLHRRLYLTRAEAAQYSGLPLSEIMLRIKSQELPAIRTGRGWRIRRRDLERLQIIGPVRGFAQIDDDEPPIRGRARRRTTETDPQTPPAVVLQNPLDHAINVKLRATEATPYICHRCGEPDPCGCEPQVQGKSW